MAAGYISFVIAERQAALQKVSRYNEAWTVSQTLSEFMRLEHRLASLAVPGAHVDVEEVRLRLDIMYGRLDILEQGTLRDFIGSEPEHSKLLRNVRLALDFVDVELARLPLDVRPALARLDVLDGPMTALASTASDFGAARTRADQMELEQLHYIYSGVAAGLILCGILLVILLLQHNHLLERAHSKMERLARNLKDAGLQLQTQNGRLEHTAHHDSLTGLPNRVLLRQQLDGWYRSSDPNSHGAVLLLDLDGFKDVNDTLGHDAGDDLLKAVAERLLEATGSGGRVCRLGGDEFAVFVPVTDPIQLTHRLLEHVGRPYHVSQRTLTISTSIGMANVRDALDSDELLKNADLALYDAKGSGRGRACVFERSMYDRFRERKALEADLRQAIDNGELQVHYQPQVNSLSQALEGYEALVRWNHPVRGSVPPANFIPLAEEIGLIHELGEWVLRTACAEAAGWPAAVTLSVNLSPLQFKARGLLHCVASALDFSGLAPSRLELEITESVLLEADERVHQTFASLRGLGIRVAMDDFGTGYSSLGALRQFPFDKIKIDRSFVRDIVGQADALTIVGLVIGVAKTLGMAVTAEGVETEEQYQMLRALGCDQMQGYRFGRPVPAGDLWNDKAIKHIEGRLHIPRA